MHVRLNVCVSHKHRDTPLREAIALKWGLDSWTVPVETSTQLPNHHQPTSIFDKTPRCHDQVRRLC